MAQAPQLLAAYLAVGPDELKRKETLSRLKTRAAGPFEAFNIEEIEASADLEPQTLLSSLNTLPMGADRRFVIVENAEKLPKPVSEAPRQVSGEPERGLHAVPHRHDLGKDN